MDVSTRTSKWIVQLPEFDYMVMVEEFTGVALADILMHQFREKKDKESKSSQPLLPSPLTKIEQAYALYFDGYIIGRREE